MGLLYGRGRQIWLRRKIGSAVERSLQQVPGLLDPAAAPFDVLPISEALSRVHDAENGASLLRHHSSPAELTTLAVGGNPAPEQRSHKQVVWRLVVLFVALDASKSLAVSWAAVHGKMCAPLVICAKNALSIACGMVLASSMEGAAGVRQCLDMRRALKVLPISGCFCAAQITALQALRAFDAGSLKIIAQVNLPTTALLSWLLLGRQYSARQWTAIGLMLVASMSFLQVRMLFFEPLWYEDDVGGDFSERVMGKRWRMILFLLGIVLSCAASVFAERFLIKRFEIPFYIQKTNLMFGELLAGFLMVHSNSRSDGGDICSWEQMTQWGQLPVAVIWFVHGWIAGLLVKRCSALVKNISHILSALVIYVLPSLLGTDGLKSAVNLSALLVLAAVLVWATVPKGPGRGRSQKRGTKGKRRMEDVEATLPRASSDLAYVRKHCKADTPVAATALVVPAPMASQPARSSRSSGTSQLSLGLLVLCFIVLDALKPLLVTWAHQEKATHERFIQGTFFLVQTSLSLLVGLAIAAQPFVCLAPLSVRLHPQWCSRVYRCVDPRAVTAQLPCAFCLSLGKLLMLMALGRLDAGTVRVFGPASLPFVAICSALFFSKRYSSQQWCSLVAVSIALVTFYCVKAEVVEKEQATGPGRGIEVVGVSLILASICFNCLGALFIEKFLKRGRGCLHEQKAQLLLGEVVVNGFLVCGMPLVLRDPTHSPWHRGLFAGWDLRVLTCAIVWIPAGWTATMLVKRCSNLLKNIAQGTAGVLTYIFSVVPLNKGPRLWSFFVTQLGPPLEPEPLSQPVVFLAMAVMLSALTFGLDRYSPEEGAPKPQHWKVDPAYKAITSDHGELTDASSRSKGSRSGGLTPIE